MSRDKGLDYLLDLDGEVWVQDRECWVKIEVRKLDQETKECPHGIKYCLTLHDPHGERLMGFDNAHQIKTKKKGRYIGRSIVYDHKHLGPGDKGVPYVFESSVQLLTDFFVEVDKVLKDRA
ncbi:MAG: DUF6516 family protein [Desulfuromusa sp.]|nr:DUF6516 family protein [Desulfuromusa sp.]